LRTETSRLVGVQDDAETCQLSRTELVRQSRPLPIRLDIRMTSHAARRGRPVLPALMT
jgi:hypothetical protein